MAEKEIYHLDVVIGVKGDEDTKEKLSAMDKYIARLEKRTKIMDKISMSPSIRINDKATKQIDKVNSTLNKLNKVAATPTVKINDKVTEQMQKVNGSLNKLKNAKVISIVDIYDRASKPINNIDNRLKNLNKSKVAPMAQLNDEVTQPAKRINAVLEKLNKLRVGIKTNIVDRISGPTRTILYGLGKIKNTTWSATVTIKDKASSGLSIIRSGISRTIGMAVSLQGLLLGVGGTWAGFVKPMQIAGDYEQTQMAFTTMLKSAQKANDFLAQAQNMANDTPFEFPQLANASKKLLAFGWDAKSILPDLRTIGDASAGLGLGAKGIDEITLALGQMKAKGRVQGDEILQLTEAGIPATKILQEQLGLTADQVANIGNQGIAADKAISALLTGMDKRFGGMMQAQSKTALGLISTLKDTFENKILNQWGTGLWTGIKPGLIKVTDWLDKNDKKVTELGSLFRKAGENVSSFIGGGIEDAQQRLSKLMDSKQWKNASIGGKITLAWDKVIAEPFSAWWNGPGKPQINKVASDMGSSIGGTLGNGIVSFLDALGGKEDKVGDSGTSAGTAFTNAFLEAFDTGKIFDKLISSFTGANINAAKNPNASTLTKAGLMDYILLGTLGGSKLIKGGSKAYKWLRYGSAAGKTASGVAGAGAKAAENVSGISKIANFLKKAGAITNSKVFKALPVIGPLATFATSAYAVNSSSNKARTVSGLAGNLTGSSIGGKIGGTIGSIFGPIGTGVGYLAGSAIGWHFGGKAATGLYDKYNANSSANKIPTGFTKSFKDVTQSNTKNVGTTQALNRSQSGLTLQSNAYRGSLGNLLSSTGLTVDSQGRLIDASGQYEGSLNDLLSSTGLMLDSNGNLLDVNSLVQDSQANLALSMTNLSDTVNNLNGNMGGLGNKQSEGLWGKVKNFFGIGNSPTTSSTSKQVNTVSNNSTKGTDVLSILTGKPTYKANGGVTTGPELSVIGEAGSEAIIPLSSNRRNRGLSLWQQAGRILGVRMFANGGIVGNGTSSGGKQKTTASLNTTISLGDDSLSSFKQYGKKINDYLGNGIVSEKKIPDDSMNKVTDSSKGILNLFSKTGHIYGIGIDNDIAEGINSATGNVTSIVKTLTDKVIEQFKTGFGIHSPSRVFYKLSQFIPQGVIKGMSSVDVKSFINKWMSDIISSAGAVGGNVSGWISSALAITGSPMSWLPKLLDIASRESGNPGQLGTGNASLMNSGPGSASGLMQCMPDTFAEFALPGLGDIFNPIANAVAAIRYIKSRYGTPFNIYTGPGYQGYATGTDNAKKGLARINERGWEFVDFTGGEKVLTHTKSVSLMERAANSIRNVKTAVSSLAGTTAESKSVNTNPIYYTSQPQMAMAGASYGSINVKVDNKFSNDVNVEDIVKQATAKFATELRKTLQNTKR
ncbi:tape measure protein [Clostridium sp. 001]|uniref:tape measure protein n=1 Tax=Clostridium sp. 001 TaxID=1970093 RepID=UPI0020B737D7|nr:tape measure protein [Clostridium sp. 001]